MISYTKLNCIKMGLVNIKSSYGRIRKKVIDEAMYWVDCYVAVNVLINIKDNIGEITYHTLSLRLKVIR